MKMLKLLLMIMSDDVKDVAMRMLMMLLMTLILRERWQQSPSQCRRPPQVIVMTDYVYGMAKRMIRLLVIETAMKMMRVTEPVSPTTPGLAG